MAKFKTTKIVITMAAALLVFFGHHSAQAAETPNIGQGAAIVTTAPVLAFCANVDASTTALNQLLSDSEVKYNDAALVRSQTLAQVRAASDAALADARTKADASYADQYKALTAQAATKAEKKAVTAFQKVITQAIHDRRAAVDLAIKTYRDGVDQVLATRAATYTNAIGSLKASIDSVYAKAKNDCITATPAADVQTTAVADVTAAHAKYDTMIATLDKDTTNLDALAATRDEAVSTADANFQTSVQSAATTLKAVIGNK